MFLSRNNPRPLRLRRQDSRSRVVPPRPGAVTFVIPRPLQLAVGFMSIFLLQSLI